MNIIRLYNLFIVIIVKTSMRVNFSMDAAVFTATALTRESQYRKQEVTTKSMTLSEHKHALRAYCRVYRNNILGSASIYNQTSTHYCTIIKHLKFALVLHEV
jgi:hypothetical protein